MIRALLTGTLYGDPQARTSQGGKSFVTAKLRADAKDGATVWCSLVAFGEQSERLATLKSNAAISVPGRVEVQSWLSKDGEPQAGLSLVIDELTTLKAKPKPRSDQPPRSRPAPQSGTQFDDDFSF